MQMISVLFSFDLALATVRLEMVVLLIDWFATVYPSIVVALTPPTNHNTTPGARQLNTTLVFSATGPAGSCLMLILSVVYP